MKYTQKIIPVAHTPEAWKKISVFNLRKSVLEFIRKNYAGLTIINEDLKLPIVITVNSCKKTAFGEAMYLKKAACALILPDLIKYASYNNFGSKKENDSDSLIGYLNFKCKCVIDGKKEYVRLSVQFQKGGKYYYNIEINKKVCTT